MYNPMDISRIDRQIDELQRLKSNYQAMQQPQQPINNIITSQPMTPTQPVAPLFEAKFTNENPADILVHNKTAFIDLKNGKLTIKELDGELKEYGLILPKDEKDIRIEELETKMKKLEESYNALLVQGSIPKESYQPVNNVALGGMKIPDSMQAEIDSSSISNMQAVDTSISNSIDGSADVTTVKTNAPKKSMFNKQK